MCKSGAFEVGSARKEFVIHFPQTLVERFVECALKLFVLALVAQIAHLVRVILVVVQEPRTVKGTNVCITARCAIHDSRPSRNGARQRNCMACSAMRRNYYQQSAFREARAPHHAPGRSQDTEARRAPARWALYLAHRLGSSAYASPSQACGDTAREMARRSIRPRGDVWRGALANPACPP